MLVTIHDAKSNLSKLIEAAQAGEDVVIARGRTPVARLVSIGKAQFKLDILKGKLKGPAPDFFQPMDEEELKLWEGGA